MTKLTAAPAGQEGKETFGQQLIRLRTERGFATSSDLARAIWGEKPDGRGFMVARNRDTIWRFETDKSLPSRKNLELLAAALQLPVDDLDPFKGTSKSKPKIIQTVQQAMIAAGPRKLVNEKVGPDQHLLVVHMVLPEAIAKKAFDEIAEWWSRSEHQAEVNIVEHAETLPNPLKKKP